VYALGVAHLAHEEALLGGAAVARAGEQDVRRRVQEALT
jgi:hypothetical protein